jgi:nitroimidazol reductase NimA-like FMN-containing flavoprotein (pyridoxamine 5'-phosphate oxidase superfamily)
MTNTPTARTSAKRFHDRARYDAETVHAILDAQPNCTVAYVIDGTPYATPTLQWREGDTIYWHGSSASRMLRKSTGHQVCVSVMLFDGMVMARSAFNHSCNYRSVTAFGQAFIVTDPAEKRARLDTFVETLFPGRTKLLRPMLDQEIKATTILGLKLDEVSAKIRADDPEDDAADYALPIWAGVIPFALTAGEIRPDPRLIPGTPMPDHIANYKIG